MSTLVCAHYHIICNNVTGIARHGAAPAARDPRPDPSAIGASGRGAAAAAGSVGHAR
jgi:hypothetical protein